MSGLHLRAGRWSAHLLPGRGAAFERLDFAARPVLRPLDGSDPNATRAGSFWMAPWTNRLDGGAFGEGFRFPINRPDEGNALHGLVREHAWEVVDSSPGHAVLTQSLAAPPFDVAARLDIALTDDGVTLALTLRNKSSEPCPLGIGWHPWFHRPPGTRLDFAAQTQLATDARSLPIAAEPADTRHWLGQDRHFTGWNGTARFATPDHMVTLEATGAWAHNLQLFAPLETPVLCLEPVSHPPNAINQAGFGSMHLVQPGQALEGQINIQARPGE
ncbi:aldose epimerase [Roseomonas sp. 18066]|uniref:aldose epimerase family protein n=1 Tax=Roseomonas sp. 18066 TaxID=2681412 RepID=UPI001F442C4C|nr:aldose epimerase [Roseomonas sp. 18066]